MLDILFNLGTETTETEDESKLSKEDSAFLDYCYDIGKMCWQTFADSFQGKVVVAKLPSDAVRDEAKRLFLIGFGARLFLCPPVGPEALDPLLGPIACEKAWKFYLSQSEGKTILDGKPYPETFEAIVGVARHFFMRGFQAGNVAAREFTRK